MSTTHEYSDLEHRYTFSLARFHISDTVMGGGLGPNWLVLDIQPGS